MLQLAKDVNEITPLTASDVVQLVIVRVLGTRQRLVGVHPCADLRPLRRGGDVIQATSKDVGWKRALDKVIINKALFCLMQHPKQ